MRVRVGVAPCGARHLDELRDDAEGVALVDEELLPLARVEHLLRVARDERVEEGVELVPRIRLPTELELGAGARPLL